WLVPLNKQGSRGHREKHCCDRYVQRCATYRQHVEPIGAPVRPVVEYLAAVIINSDVIGPIRYVERALRIAGIQQALVRARGRTPCEDGVAGPESHVEPREVRPS